MKQKKVSCVLIGGAGVCRVEATCANLGLGETRKINRRTKCSRPNRKSKPPQSPLRKAVRCRTRGAVRHSTQDHQKRKMKEACFCAWKHPLHFNAALNTSTKSCAMPCCLSKGYIGCGKTILDPVWAGFFFYF